ncbi:diguanylate cyclase [Kineosporia sp. NBRC 101731]|uniref:diguanylate cyclase n=1 Tax=Kineosporia sp. NBRC 101731 TaxID=3032199 RepID=UPI00255446CB|nr:diguanylate cyclase [Kineosporia sp. NBRC 101731]
MRGLPEELTRDGVSPLADVEKLVVEGRYGRADLALRRLEALIPSLAQTADDETLLLALYGRAVLLRRLGGGHQTAIAACDVLERAAHERQAGLWAAIACATRAQFRVDSGDIGGATADLARADSALAGDELTDESGYRLLNGLAVVYAGLRLQDRADEMRTRIEHTISSRSTLDRAEHWAIWATELAARAMEPLAGGAQDPQQELMSRAVELATKVDNLPEDAVPGTLRRGGNGVRALAAAYRGRPSEALRLLGPDAFGTVGDLPAAERQIISLAAMRAHALVGSLATARSLDDAAISPPATLPNLVLEVCRTRERLWLETYANGEVVPVLHRMTELLVRLGWRGMDLVADTARQALEHQALRTESRTDALTGVGNRRALDEELRQLLRFGPLPLALILVDVDHFKEINDRFTHVVADEVLRRVAASLSLQLRTDDQLLRYGGDEFVVLLPGTGDEEANAVAERMRVAVDARPWNELADGLEVSISTGCAAVWSLSGRRPDADAEKLFRRADERLLAAKRERPGDHEVRSLIGPSSPGWGDESTDDVAAMSMPPTPTRTLGAEVLGPHSRPGSPHPAPPGLNGGRRAGDPNFEPDHDEAATGTPVNGTPVNGVQLNGTPVNGTPVNGNPVNGTDLRLPPPGDPALTDALADREIEKGSASSEIRRFGSTDSGAAPGPGSSPVSPPPAGSRRSRRAARDAEAHSPMNGIAVEKQQAEAAAAVAARQAADARERQAREEAEKAELEAQRREKEERERIEAEARRLAEQMDRERREAEARAEAERRERERQAAFAQAEAERLEAERLERERIERERERAERERAERERAEAERLERERAEAERLEAERRERERRRLEAERRERERVEAERREAEARAKAEAERLERERLERERKEAEARAKAEAERLERERLERERKEAEARAKAEAERLERERQEAEARARAERLAAEKAEKERLEKERQAALAKAEAERLEKQRAERERRIHEARERAAAARREREARERAEREEAEKIAREQAAREESERRRLEEVRRAAEEIRREAYERAAKLAASASSSSSTWPTAQGPHTGGWMMPSAAALESPTTPSAPIPDSLAPPNDPSRSEPNRRERRPEPAEADRRFQETAAQIYRPDPNLGPSTETIRALSDPLNDPLPGQSRGGTPSAGDSYSGSSYGSGSDYSSSGSYSGGYGGGYQNGYQNGSPPALPALPSAPTPPLPAAPSPYSNTPEEPQAPWRPTASDPWGAGPAGPRTGNGWSEDDEVDLRDDQGQLPGTGNRDQSGPSTSRQAIIDLSARRRHRSPND